MTCRGGKSLGSRYRDAPIVAVTRAADNHLRDDLPSWRLMAYIVWMALALVVAGTQLWRERAPRSRRRTLEALVLWWLVIALGASSLLTGIVHIADATGTASRIGFTQGDGGFHFEVAMANLAIGAICVLGFWFRDRLWLAGYLAASIFLLGAGYGHIYQLVQYDNHSPDNSGVILYTDFIVPIVGLVLYALLERAGGARPRRTAAASRAASGTRGDVPDQAAQASRT